MLRLRVMQNVLQLPVYIFSSPFPSRRCFWTKAFLGMFYHLLLKKRENTIGFASLDTLNKICIKNVPKDFIREACDTWYAMCFREYNNGVRKWAYTVTDIPYLW